MIENNSSVASVDATLPSVDVNRYIAGLGAWVQYWIDKGFEGYIATFMFRLSQLEGRAKDKMMREEIERVYSRFVTECVRYPWSERNRNNRPILIACQDWPVWKRNKKDRLVLLPWEGAHWGSVLLVPPWNRLKNGVKDHFETYQRSSYVRHGFPVSRIHIEHISYQPGLATEYVCKSLVRRRSTIDDLLILPFSELERPTTAHGVE